MLRVPKPREITVDTRLLASCSTSGTVIPVLAATCCSPAGLGLAVRADRPQQGELRGTLGHGQVRLVQTGGQAEPFPEQSRATAGILVIPPTSSTSSK